MRKNLAGGILIGLVLVAVPAAAGQSQDRALPDRDTFIAEVRARLRTDEELQNQYTYLERRQRIRISRLGHVEIGDTRLFEVYPGSEPGERYRRLLAINDVPLAAGVLQQRDATRNNFLSDRAEILANETLPERRARQRKQAEIRQRQQDIVDDVFRVFEIRLIGEDVIDGQRAIVAGLTPRSGVAARSRTSSDVLVGLGLVGRVQRGSRFTFERERTNDEVWLPSRVVVELAGRTLLVRKFSVRAVTEFSDYKKFAVTTSETLGTQGLAPSSR